MKRNPNRALVTKLITLLVLNHMGMGKADFFFFQIFIKPQKTSSHNIFSLLLQSGFSLLKEKKRNKERKKERNLVTVLDTLDHGITAILAAAYQCHHLHLLLEVSLCFGHHRPPPPQQYSIWADSESEKRVERREKERGSCSVPWQNVFH